MPCFALAIPLAACASPAAEYPSLAMRDGERIVGEMETAPAAPYIAPSPPPATVEEAVALAAQARGVHGEFTAAEPGVRARIGAARGTFVGSETWSDAQVALTILESHHGRLTVMLADIDALYVDTSSEGQAVALLAEERDAVAAMASAQAETIASLLAAIPR
ncbi:hypothetical protein OOZ52_09025 [Aurantiacibacter sp. D1-12]|nr:hypothetical protein [Aurantiacibacter sp. D1-12]